MKDVHTIESAAKIETPSLAVMRKEYGSVKTEAYLKLWLVDLNEFLCLKHPLTEDQIDFIAESIVQDFYNICVADIKVVFSRAKKGVYGEFYERLSPPKVVSWFRQYYEDRMGVFAEINRMDHSKKIAPEKMERSRRENAQHIGEVEFKNFKHQRNLENFEKKIKEDE